MHIDATLLSPLSALLGALIGGGTSLVAAVYSQRVHDRLQRLAREADKRESVYADFVMSASNMLLTAFVKDGVSIGADEQHLIGLINRMRLFAPCNVVGAAEAVLKAIIEIALQPSIELRQLAKDALARRLDPDPLLTFSRLCRADLDFIERGGYAHATDLPRNRRIRAAPLADRVGASMFDIESAATGVGYSSLPDPQRTVALPPTAGATPLWHTIAKSDALNASDTFSNLMYQKRT